jgi:hypothetical protein
MSEDQKREYYQSQRAKLLALKETEGQRRLQAQAQAGLRKLQERLASRAARAEESATLLKSVIPLTAR